MGHDTRETKDKSAHAEPERVEDGSSALFYILAQDQAIVNVAPLFTELLIVEHVRIVVVEADNKNGKAEQLDGQYH